ncbi:MAG TPA: hypothetical protein VI793_07685 [Anaerolineales bacterium]|nr:hypothetical protein [Anaerolineales bacterium]
MHLPTLRSIVLTATGQDLRKCQHCAFCNTQLDEEQDIALETLVQLVLMNDEEVLTSRTLWSDRVLQSARQVCANSLNLEAILLTLRAEALRRGISGSQA